MRGKGINYDTGFFPGGKDSRPGFDPETAREELRIIADDLHCTAVRVSGSVPERLEAAARAAAAAGLEVWFAPFPCELTAEQLLEYLADCARRAEAVRAEGAEVVFVAGCETSLFCPGYFDGDDTSLAARRVFGIADRFLLERRAAELADACGVPIEALDLALANFGRPDGRVTQGAGAVEPDLEAQVRAEDALGV